MPPTWFGDTRGYRGSIVNLDEDTPYEVRVSDGIVVTSSPEGFEPR